MKADDPEGRRAPAAEEPEEDSRETPGAFFLFGARSTSPGVAAAGPGQISTLVSGSESACEGCRYGLSLIKLMYRLSDQGKQGKAFLIPGGQKRPAGKDG